MSKYPKFPPFLLRKQKNDLFTAIQTAGFAPSDFSLVENVGQVELRYRSTDYHYNISNDHAGPFFMVTYSPGQDRITETRRGVEWPTVYSAFDVWLELLNDELQAPDLWATISGDSQLITLAADQNNQPFTPDEQLQVKRALKEIKVYLIQTHSVSGTRLEAMEKQLSYLEDAATRLGRKDWTVILLGSLLSMVSTLSLSSDGTKDLFRFARQIVKQLLGTILYLAGPH